MSYPTLEQYNEAFQHPRTALDDPDLKRGSTAKTGLGLPLALCGGFALTYTITSGADKYAVRCFHKKSSALEDRYRSISARLGSLRSSYFVDFDFQARGVRVGGNFYPVVKMAWAAGKTLGEFLEENYDDPASLRSLRSSLRDMARYLERKAMAHGDIQPGNVMVANGGEQVQLIDYDGIFVDELRSLGSAELGHRNFQHPNRSSRDWDSTLDRFSFASLDLSLRALERAPRLWSETQSDGDSVVFKANDFASPERSNVFARLWGGQEFVGSDVPEDARNFADICRSPFDSVPTLENFLARRHIPIVKEVREPRLAEATKYLSAFPVRDAKNYSACLGSVGDKVELIGRIVEVAWRDTSRGKPYVFINFGPWRGDIVKVTIWSDGLGALTTKPDASWKERWISVTGLMQSPYPTSGHFHLSIFVTKGNELHFISEDEARFRLSGSSTRASASDAAGSGSSNRERLEKIRGIQSDGRAPSVRPVSGNRRPVAPPITRNESIGRTMRDIRSARSAVPPQSPGSARLPGGSRVVPPPHHPAPSARSQPPSSSRKCFVATAVYGADASETAVLREWRDRSLLPRAFGRALVAVYYTVSPHLVPLLTRSRRVRRASKSVLDRLVRLVSADTDR